MSAEAVVSSGRVKVRPATCSFSALWPSQVMRVSLPPSTALPLSAFGLAVHLAVSSANAPAGMENSMRSVSAMRVSRMLLMGLRIVVRVSTVVFLS